MDQRRLTRREILKLAWLLPFSMMKWPRVLSPEPYQDHKPSPNILILVFDALSANHMSLYGYARNTTPSIEKAARSATVYHRHYSAGTYTTPSVASILTGVYPWSHRAFHIYGTVARGYQERNLFQLVKNHYRSFAYSHNTFTNILLHQFGSDIDLLFKRSDLSIVSNHYSDQIHTADFNALSQAEDLLFWRQNGPPGSFLLSRLDRSKRLSTEARLNEREKERFPRGVPNSGLVYFTIEQAVDWIQEQSLHQPNPFLGYVHLLPPHHPYTTRADFIDLFNDGWQPVEKPASIFSEGRSQAFLNDQRRQYDEFIAYVDAEFGRLYDSLRESGVLDHTYLILTSDHGEMFERGIWMHNTRTQYEPIIRTPLLIWSPGQNQRIDVHHPTSCVDLLPTILHAIGKEVPSWCEGQRLNLRGESAENGGDAVFVVDAKENPAHQPLKMASISLVKDRYKISYYYGYDGYDDRIELYDLENDPEEIVELSRSAPSRARELMDELMMKLSGADLKAGHNGT